jgi:N-acyl-D-amino-acid deacylase
MHDIVIRGGTIIDGTGRAAFTGDLAVDEGRVAAIGGKAGPARRDIAADGLLVTPGWVDVHTHYDGQATWDPIPRPPHGTAPRPFCSAIAGSVSRRSDRSIAMR